MQTHLKKRIEIIIEEPSLRRLTQMLDALGVSGYTVFPATAGMGHHGPWSRAGQVSSARGMVLVLCITDEERAHSVLDKIFPMVERQIGIVSVSDVQVVRGDHF